MIKYLSNVQDSAQSHYKIFCNFHKKDSAHFQKIKNDIFEICNCSLFYYDNEAETDDKSELEFEISRSNLYLLIVSSNVLFDPDFNKQSFDTAIKNNIPVLPILVENGIETYFNEKFGNIQCISTCLEMIDPSAVPYTVKLQNFLTQTLSLSFDINTLRQSFDASIFLSYRKKDRKYAQNLLDVIHQSDELKNIAIWYDEFLVPGEDFNDSIKSEIENSAIFVLMVTPSILEGENYIKIIEYPVAHSLNKTILPVEMVITNANRLKSDYPDLPETISSSATEQLKDTIKNTLKKNGIAIRDRTVERDFFIGYAFLKGLYVEKNTSVALDLINNSANAGFHDAIATLVSIYKYGDGCEVDTEKAAEWQNKYITQLLDNFKNSPTKENAEAVLDSYKELSDIFVRGKNTVAAADAFMEIVSFLNRSPFKDDIFTKIHSAEAYESAARLFISDGNYTKARYTYIEKAIELRKEIYSSHSIKNAVIDLICIYLLLAECQSESDDIIGLKTTIKIELKEIGSALLDYGSSSVPVESLQFLQKVLFGLSSIGKYCNQLNMSHQAFIYIGAAVNLAKEVNIKYNNLITNMLAYNAFKIDGQQHISINVENHLKVAETSFTDALAVALSMADKSETAETALIVAESYLNLARIKHKLKDYDTAMENLKTAISSYREIFETINTIPTKQKLYKSYYIASEIYADFKQTEEALLMLESGLEINDEIVKTSTLSIYKLEMAEALKLKGDLLKKQWEFDEAVLCYEKRHKLIMDGAHKNAHIFLIAESYETLISAHKSVGNINEAGKLTSELTAFKNRYDFVFSGKVTFYS